MFVDSGMFGQTLRSTPRPRSYVTTGSPFATGMESLLKMHALTASLLSLFLMAPLASGYLGVYLSQDSKEAVVSEVIPGTPAAKAGLKSGDVLLAVGDIKTPTRDKFTAEIQKTKPGTRVKIKLRRNKRVQVVVVRLGERPESSGAGAGADVVEVAKPRKPARNPKPVGVSKPTRSAPAVEVAPRGQDSVASKEKGYLGISVREGEGGLVVDRILEGGPSAKSGLKKGDVLHVIGDHRVRSLDDLDGALKKIRPGRKVPVGVISKTAKKSLVIKVGRRPGQGRMAMDKPVQIIEVIEEPRPNVTVTAQPARGRVIELVPTETAEGVVTEVVPSEAKPSRRVIRSDRRATGTTTRSVRRTTGGTAGSTSPRRIARPTRAAKPARAANPPRPTRSVQQPRPPRPVGSSRPARPSSPSRGKGVRDSEYNLQRELSELRQELKELRVLLEKLRRDRR
ncbi:MAG: membrane-associated protease RseP (regulator of RpoE activity) [Planctomycetota bacterium]|jgi:membrane-associated protease RseP (regulator of RpoE activity)